MLDLLRLITEIRLVPRILTALLIAIGWTAMWPERSLSPILQIGVLWSLCALMLYGIHLVIHPQYAYLLAGVLLSVALAGLAVTTRVPGTAILAPLLLVHPALYAAMLVQAAVWWTEGRGWARWLAGEV